MRSTPPIALTEAAISRLLRLSVSAKGGEAETSPLAVTGGGGVLAERLPVSAKAGVGSERRELAQLRTGVVVAFSAGAGNLNEVGAMDEAADGDVPSRRKGFELSVERGSAPEGTQRLKVAVGGAGEYGIGRGGGEGRAQAGKQ